MLFSNYIPHIVYFRFPFLTCPPYYSFNTDSANRNIPAESKNKALGVSLSSIPPLQIESLDINQDILSEIAREYNIDDVSLLQEILTEITTGQVKGNVLAPSGIMAQYSPADYQNVKVRTVDGASLLYEATEPLLDQKELKDQISRCLPAFRGVFLGTDI